MTGGKGLLRRPDSSGFIGATRNDKWEGDSIGTGGSDEIGRAPGSDQKAVRLA
ncbi:MAG: hypothetical protein R6V59_02170 [Dehalococcoidia bacterium]